METFDVVVIGAGPGGYPAAICAAQLGASVAIIEREELGGACLNWGCIPTKTLISTAELLGECKRAQEKGLRFGSASVDYPALVAYKDRTISQLRGGVKTLLAANRIRLFNGTASFLARNRLAVAQASAEGNAPAAGQTLDLEAKNIIIATGTTSAMPNWLPRHQRIVDSRAFLELKTLPSRLLVLGGGYIGCELACAAAQLGSQVTLVELLEDILHSFDAEVRAEVRCQMEKRLGIRILTGQPMKDIWTSDAGVGGRVGEEALEADVLLAAVGRQPVTAALKLEAAGVKTDERGFITVDEYGRTNAATIYAVGDVNGGPQLAHAATSQGLVAAGNACSRKPRKNEKIVPAVIFTSPEIGLAGLSESEAKARGLEVKTGKFKFKSLGRAIALGQTEGFVKWIADPGTGQLLGAQVVGPHATELIAEAAMAVRAELTAEELARTIHAHPTFSEAWMEAAHALQGRAIHAAPATKTKPGA